MSMLDSFFKQRFNAAKCKTLLKLTIPRIKLLRNRREAQLKQMRKEIAKLLETGQEATARIRVEHIIREEKMMAAQEIVELFCELIAVRLPIIEAQRECPLDLKEAISSICFAAPRCADLTELLQVQLLFAGKYGKEFVIAATELMPDCGVNRQLVELLSIRAPAPDAKIKLLKEIAEEYQLDWDPSATENELLKTHEDLLNGPTQFVSGSKLPLPKEKHDETTYTASEPARATHEKSDSDSEFDMVDFPEVPIQPLQPNKTTVSTPVMLHFPESALSDDDDYQEEQNGFEHEDLIRGKSVPKEDSLSNQPGPMEAKQFLPFINPPQSSETVQVREQNSPPVISKVYDEHVDLQDVLAAARAAAESAERAAAAARSAASIAQLRISGLSKRRSSEFSVPNVDNQQQNDTKPGLDKHYSNGDSSSEDHSTHQPTPLDNVISPATAHQPQRLPSLDDFSYPNLFASQGSNVSSHSQSP